MEHFQIALAGYRIGSDLLVKFGLKAALAVLVLFVGMRLASRFANALRRGMDRAGIDPMLSGFLRNAVHAGLLALLLAMCASFAGLPTATLLGAMGAAGLALGLALSSSLSNLAWGVLLIFFRPFRVGDYILAAGVEGTVQHMTLMHTWLVMADGREAVLPNAKVGGDAIVNFSRRGQRRVEFSVGVDYRTDLAHALGVAGEAVAALPRILVEPPPEAYADALGPSQVDLLIRAWTATDDYRDAHSQAIQAVKEAFNREDIVIACPRREIHLVRGQG
ncbi:mechanosensitive ion channel family protein [Pinirhizobacter soli]|uniref:mechanosensitive ion channel family protein n=1 Tax=Pinirhizobacter soli TaxID=2786953 RepID=UPI00202A7639|nr:mechanosensitive ion channel family protein [Pinirhizobacter soli]